jgi:hypothetical protein
LHAVWSTEPAAEVLLAGHPAHAAAPASGLYAPAKHAEHGPPSAPVKPGLHTQTAAPAALCEFAGHATQTPAPVSVERELKSDEEASAKLLSERW